MWLPVSCTLRESATSGRHAQTSKEHVPVVDIRVAASAARTVLASRACCARPDVCIAFDVVINGWLAFYPSTWREAWLCFDAATRLRFDASTWLGFGAAARLHVKLDATTIKHRRFIAGIRTS